MRRMARLVVGLVVALGVGMAARGADVGRPNVVVLVADDLGYGDLGFQGGVDIPTPHLDGLAARGVRCTHGYVSGPYCSPTRAGLVTGRYQQRFGHEFNPGGGKVGLPLTERTLVESFQKAGYRTGLVGKWHLGAEPEFHPQKRGFDEFFGFLGGSHSYVPGKGTPILRGTEEVEEKEYLTDAIGREAVSFVERNKGGPFFLQVTFNAVHTPMEATNERLSKFAGIEDETRRTYAAMLSALDDAVGAILGKLREEGLAEKTLVFFVSDNGGPTMLGTTINGSKNTPLRGSKRTTLEGGVRVPFVVAWEGTLKPGVYEQPVIQLDLLPTALKAAGIEVPKGLDGVDLLPALKGDSTGAPHEALYWRFVPQWAVRSGDWKLVAYDATLDTPGARSGAGAKATEPRLYNLGSDVGESRNVAAEHPEKVRELTALWERWNAELVKPLWGPPGMFGAAGARAGR